MLSFTATCGQKPIFLDTLKWSMVSYYSNRGAYIVYLFKRVSFSRLRKSD